MSGRDYWCFALNVRIPGLGKVRLVISFDNPELSGTYAVLVSKRCDWSAKQVLVTYLQRWPIETFYQDSKRHLGLDEYRMRNAEALMKHWCLVLVAYSLLHLECLAASPRKGGGVAGREVASLEGRWRRSVLPTQNHWGGVPSPSASRCGSVDSVGS